MNRRPWAGCCHFFGALAFMSRMLAALAIGVSPAVAQNADNPDSTELRIEGPLVKSRYPVGDCTPPLYPREARRYELEGITTVSYKLLPDGRITAAAVARSSGWEMLDHATIAMLMACKYTAEQAVQAAGKLLKLQFVWSLEGDRVRPTQVADSCPTSGRFAAFLEYDPSPSDEHGIKVRFLVDREGKPRGVRLEPASLEPVSGREIAGFVEGCRFTFDPKQRGQHTDTVFGTVLLR